MTLGVANTDVGARFLGGCLAAILERTDRLQAVIVDPGRELGADTHDKDVFVLPLGPSTPAPGTGGRGNLPRRSQHLCEALWHGVPLVVAPIRDDQPVVAGPGQVTDAGAGVSVRFGRVTAGRLGTALDAVLHDPAHRAAADRIRTAFRAVGGSGAAATHTWSRQWRAPEEDQ